MNNAKFPKLFIVDLDGTALAKGQEPYARLSDRFSDFLDNLAEHGCEWGINSTWDVQGQWHLALVSSVKNNPKYLMGELGLRLAEIRNSSIEFIQPYTERMENRTEAEINKRMRPIVREIASQFMAKRMHFYGHLFDFSVVDDEKYAFNEFIRKFKEVEGLITSIGDGRFSAYPTMLGKGHPVRELMRLKGYSPSDIVVAGDETADLDMMAPSITSNPICPSNSAASVKEHVGKSGGVISENPYGNGIMEAFYSLAAERGWNFKLKDDSRKKVSSGGLLHAGNIPSQRPHKHRTGTGVGDLHDIERQLGILRSR
jgi:hydroxymethylpyrimidine pyrophosphatase-like HAD family hydrolase